MIDLIIAAAPSHADAGGLQINIVAVARWLATVALMGAGLFFVLAGTIGVLRLPDFYTRIHSAGVTDTLGAELILLALIVQSGFSQMSLKLLLVGFFLFITSPTATHAVAHAAYSAGVKPMLGRYIAPSLDEEA